MSLESALIAFGFGSAPMLFWLAAAAAPLLIHLWSRRRYHEAPWAAVQFLLAAMRKNARRIRIESWLLLAVRLLIVILIALAAAEPYLEGAGAGFTPGERTLKVMVIDGSYSMAYKPADKTRFAWAKQLAAELVRKSNEGDGFALVMMASPPSVIVGTPAMEPRDFLAEVESLQLRHGGADLPASLEQVRAILEGPQARQLSRKEVYFLTDLGRNTWGPNLRAAADDFRARLDALAQQASLVVVDLGQADAGNTAVTGFECTEPLALVGRIARFRAEVRNFSRSPRTGVPVELVINGRPVAERQVNLAADGRATVTFDHRFDVPGPQAAEVRTGPDQLELDNHRWLSLVAKPHLRVLCVNGKPASEGFSGATDFLALALNPDADTQAGAVLPEVVLESALVEQDLADYDSIFLCNVGQFTAAEAYLLSDYLKQGGGLVFFLGDQVLPDRYNQQLGPGSPAHVLPATILGVAPVGRYPIDPLDYRHELVRAFASRQQAGLLTTPVYRYFRLQLPTGSKAKVALAFSGGDPAIVEEAVQRGRSIIVATDGSLSSIDSAPRQPWTMLPVWPSYVPLVQELLYASISGKIREPNVVVGQPIAGRLPAATADGRVLVTLPGGERNQATITADKQEWSYVETDTSGIYTVQTSSQPDGPERFAVNVDPAESDLTKLRPDELPKAFTMNAPSAAGAPQLSAAAAQSNLAPELLCAAGAVLLLETFLAWRFGNQAA